MKKLMYTHPGTAVFSFWYGAGVGVVHWSVEDSIHLVNTVVKQ